MLKSIQRKNDIYVLGNDGFYYKNPILQDNTGQWFIVFSDKDIYLYTMNHCRLEESKRKAANIFKLMKMDGEVIDIWNCEKHKFPNGIVRSTTKTTLNIFSEKISVPFIRDGERYEF